MTTEKCTASVNSRISQKEASNSKSLVNLESFTTSTETLNSPKASGNESKSDSDIKNKSKFLPCGACASEKRKLVSEDVSIKVDNK